MEPSSEKEPLSKEEQDIENLITVFGKIRNIHRTEINEIEAAHNFLTMKPEQQRLYVGPMSRRVFSIHRECGAAREQNRWNGDRDILLRAGGALAKLLNQIVRRRMSLTLVDLEALIDCATEAWGAHGYYGGYSRMRPGDVVKAVEFYLKSHETTPELQDLMKKLREASVRLRWGQEYPKVEARIDTILALGEPLTPAMKFDEGEPWADVALADLNARGETEKAKWMNLVNHASSADQARPTKKWLKEAERLIGEIGHDDFGQTMKDWLPHVKENPKEPFGEKNLVVLKGLVWCCGVAPETETIRLVGDVCEASFKKIPGWGARSAKAGNACIAILAEIPGTEPVGQLVRLNQRVRSRAAKILIERTLNRVAEREGITKDALEELALPDFGLTGVGELRESFGDFTAEAKIVGTDKIELTWARPGGKSQKSVPKSVREEHGDRVKVLKKNVRDIEKFLLGQRSRIERFCLTDPVWKLKDWRQFYLDHPLLANMTRRLIWDFREGELISGGILQDGEFVNELGDKIEWLTEESEVRLWHPLGQPVELVQAWRQRLEQDEIVQPFKQAHREIYVLTDAERETGVYSNRFAAHILRQHQMAALMQERNWAYGLQGMWDGDSRPTLKLPNAPMTAEFWVEAVVDEEQVSDMGVCLYVATDQVRFCDLESREPIALEGIPPRIFSEVFREVDLFVGVSSVGNDPAWVDSGERAVAHREYWESYAFGDLTQTAQTRREAFERLLPRLKIAEKCRIEEKFLIVQGDVRTYKIHLGSGNIRMEPNNQYLCIVAGWNKKGVSPPRALPFEGDRKFAEILSKAFMLADDKKIKDKTILSQIHGRSAFE